jgi:hypothetical protein
MTELAVFHALKLYQRTLFVKVIFTFPFRKTTSPAFQRQSRLRDNANGNEQQNEQ